MALGYGLDDRGFESQQGVEIFVFIIASRPAPGPISPFLCDVGTCSRSFSWDWFHFSSVALLHGWNVDIDPKQKASLSCVKEFDPADLFSLWFAVILCSLWRMEWQSIKWKCCPMMGQVTMFVTFSLLFTEVIFSAISPFDQRLGHACVDQQNKSEISYSSEVSPPTWCRMNCACCKVLMLGLHRLAANGLLYYLY
jgi:hypothetical protein